MSSPVTVAFGPATDPGQRRAINEDSYLADAPVFLVADGMGGHHAGEIASATVIDEFAGFAGRDSLGIDEVIFYWPPLEDVLAGRSPPPAQQTAFERVATQRVTPGS